MSLFNIFKKKNKLKVHRITLDYNEMEKKTLQKDKGITTLLISDVEFVVKEDPLFKSFGKFKADAYGVIENINIKIFMTNNMFYDNHIDVKPEYVKRFSVIINDFKTKYDLIVSRISLETASYLNSMKIRENLYTQEEVELNIKTNNITICLGNDCVFACWLDDETVLYKELEDGSYKVEIHNEEA